MKTFVAAHPCATLIPPLAALTAWLLARTIRHMKKEMSTLGDDMDECCRYISKRDNEHFNNYQ